MRRAQVDILLHADQRLTAIEVKTAFSAPPRGLAAFRAQFPRARTLVVGAGSGAIALEDFLARPATGWLG